MGKLIKGDFNTILPIPVDDILDSAKGKLSAGIVVGWDGDDLYLASSHSEIGEILLLLEAAKRTVMESIE